MGFYRSEPFNTASAVLVAPPSADIPVSRQGTIVVTVKGCAPNYTGGIQLVRDTNKPGLTIEVMGWTGPLGQGCTEYKVSHSFPSEGDNTVTVIGSNKSETIHLRHVPQEQADSTVKAAFAA